MRTNRSISTALTLTLALTLSACDDGDPPSGADGTSADVTRDQVEAETAMATDDASETASGSPAGDDTDDDSDDAEGTGEAASTGEATAADDDTDDDGEDDDSDGIVGGGPAADLTPSALAAIETALEEVDGTAYAVDDREDGFWEVAVVTSDGTVEVTVGPDGTTVDGTTQDPDDALEDAGRDALAQARVTLAEAIVAAVRAAGAQLDSAGLEEEDGTWWWRVVVDSADQDDVELRVDPATGEVVAGEG